MADGGPSTIKQSLSCESGADFDTTIRSQAKSIDNGCASSNTFGTREIVLYTKIGPIPLKKKRIYIEKLEETFFFPKEIQTELSGEEVDLLFKHYRESVEERKSTIAQNFYSDN